MKNALLFLVLVLTTSNLLADDRQIAKKMCGNVNFFTNVPKNVSRSNALLEKITRQCPNLRNGKLTLLIISSVGFPLECVPNIKKSVKVIDDSTYVEDNGCKKIDLFETEFKAANSLIVCPTINEIGVYWSGGEGVGGGG